MPKIDILVKSSEWNIELIKLFDESKLSLIVNVYYHPKEKNHKTKSVEELYTHEQEEKWTQRPEKSCLATATS